MSAEQAFQLAYVGWIVVPGGVALGVLASVWPRNLVARSFLAVVFGWIASVLFTARLYNPAGIAYGHAIGQHFPESHYDNSTIGSAILGGWIYPTLFVAVFCFGRMLWHRRGKHAGGAQP